MCGLFLAVGWGVGVLFSEMTGDWSEADQTGAGAADKATVSGAGEKAMVGKVDTLVNEGVFQNREVTEVVIARSELETLFFHSWRPKYEFYEALAWAQTLTEAECEMILTQPKKHGIEFDELFPCAITQVIFAQWCKTNGAGAFAWLEEIRPQKIKSSGFDLDDAAFSLGFAYWFERNPLAAEAYLQEFGKEGVEIGLPRMVVRMVQRSPEVLSELHWMTYLRWKDVDREVVRACLMDDGFDNGRRRELIDLLNLEIGEEGGFGELRRFAHLAKFVPEVAIQEYEKLDTEDQVSASWMILANWDWSWENEEAVSWYLENAPAWDDQTQQVLDVLTFKRTSADYTWNLIKDFEGDERFDSLRAQVASDAMVRENFGLMMESLGGIVSDERRSLAAGKAIVKNAEYGRDLTPAQRSEMAEAGYEEVILEIEREQEKRKEDEE